MTDEQPHQHVFVLPPRGVSCQRSAGRLLAEQLCVFNTLPGPAASSSCVHSCTNVISAPRYHPDGCLASCRGASRLLLPGSLLKPPRAVCVCVLCASQGVTCTTNTTSFCLPRPGDHHDFRQRQQRLFGARKLHGRQPGLLPRGRARCSPRGRGRIALYPPRETAHPSARGVHPRRALASAALPLLSSSLRVLKSPTCLSLFLSSLSPPPPAQ